MFWEAISLIFKCYVEPPVMGWLFGLKINYFFIVIYLVVIKILYIFILTFKTINMTAIDDLPIKILKNGFTFKFNLKNNFYECKGDICHDEDGGEIPEASLFGTAVLISWMLKIKFGVDSEATHSEKGWVEVQIKS